MKALLLAAGLGTRLRPFTFFQSKASLPLMNVPFIRYPLQFLYSQNIQEIVINLHSHPDSVQIAAGGTDYKGIPISYSREPQILGTAGAIRKAQQFLGDEPFLVLNGDMICDIQLQSLFEQHQRSQALITLAIMKGENWSHYSALKFDDAEIPRMLPSAGHEGQRYHYTGVQILSPEIYEQIPSDRKTDIFTDIYPALAESGKIAGFVYDGIWMEMGSLREYLATAIRLQADSVPEHLTPDGMLNTPISPDASVESSAGVTESILMAGAKIKSGITVEHCIIGWDVTVAQNLRNVALARGILPWYIR
jgi:mannose-1-phosphate guanylyltransferase